MVKLFTSESVTEGHPDKVCDIISDTILDACLKQDKGSRVAVECLAKNNTIVVAGELTSTAQLDVPSLARTAVRSIGYAGQFEVLTLINQQSPDIALGVDKDGAGDQGLMFGYATDETDSLMPAPIHYAHKLAQQLALVRKQHDVDFLLPDGKTQVTMNYEDGKPTSVHTIVISTQHLPEASQKDVEVAVCGLVINKVIPQELLTKETKILVNPTGRFVVGGPEGDCGLTGRKIIVDTYGGMGRHGGGAFSGKDPSKVDRSAAYYARYIAKNVVAHHLAKRCEVQLAYAIGVAEPVSVFVNTFGTGGEKRVTEYILDNFDMRPKAIIEELDLLNVFYKKTAAYGHFGRKEFPWEKIK